MGLKIEARPQIRGATVKTESLNKIQRYNHKGLNSLYWLAPNTKSIFLLDFKQQKFVEEMIDSSTSIPSLIQSCQISNGKVLIVGGVQNGKVLKQTYEISESLYMKQVAVMNIARCSVPIHLLKDRFIIAAGGSVSLETGYSAKYTNTCELYDITRKQWIQICSMNKARANTSISAINDRHIFIF